MTEVTLSTGLKLRLKPVPFWLIRKLQTQIVDPVPPIKMNPDTGREEPNEFDRDYLRRLSEARERRIEAGNDALLYFGIEVLEVPADFSKIEDKQWREELAMLGLTDINAKMPQVSWLKYYALRGERGYSDVFEACQRLSGVLEADVTDAEDSFRSVPQRVSDSVPIAQTDSSDRN